MSDSKISPEFKQKFQDIFWWVAPLSVFADLIAIFSLFSLKEQTKIIEQSTPPDVNFTEPRILGFITISDAVMLTGFFTLFIIVSIIYQSNTLAKRRGDQWPNILGAFLILVLGWFYFRLWLGAHGWIWSLFAIFLLSGVVTIALFRFTTISEGYRVMSVVLTTGLAFLNIFLCVVTGEFSRMERNLDSTPPSRGSFDLSSEPMQAPTLVPITVQQISTDTNSPPVQFLTKNYISYDLPPDKWFPAPLEISEGIFASEIGEVTNEKASWGNVARLELFQSWGRITSYERFYSHQDGCNSSDIKGAYIQIIFFETSDGSKKFFDWANEGANVKFTDAVGDNAYIYTESDEEDGCQIEIVSTTFQRYNVIARARIISLTVKMDYRTMEALALRVAGLIDGQLRSEIE